MSPRIVNRVRTLDRPPAADAPHAELVRYWQGWQQRHPDVDLQAVLVAAVAHVCAQLNEYLGVRIDPTTIDTRLDYFLHPEETQP